jgi:hypothetical protein
MWFQRYTVPCASLVVCVALVGCGGNAEGSAPERSAAEQALASTARHGFWVYGTEWFDTQSGQDELVKFALNYGLNNVYLSVGGIDFDDSKLPPFMTRLYENGVRAEALMGDPSWATADGHGSMLERIKAIKGYDAKADEKARFRGIHLDVEPWIDTGSDTSWIEPLIACYRAARDELSGTPLTLLADVSGTKMLSTSISVKQRQRTLDAVTRLVLMEYETHTWDVVVQRTQRFLSGLEVHDEGHGVLVGLRAQDFPDAINQAKFSEEVATNLDAPLSNEAAYLGWTLFAYKKGRLQ